MTNKTAVEATEPSMPLDDISIDELEAMMMDDNDAVDPDDVDEIEVDDVSDVEDIMSDAELDAIMADDGVEEVVEPTDDELEVAVESAENDEAIEKAYESQESDLDKPHDVSAASESDEEKPAKEAKKKREPRKTTYTNKRSEVADDRSDSSFYLLEASDLTLDEDGKKAKHDEVAAMIDGMNVKVGASCVNFLSSLNGGAKMSLFTEITFRFISREGAEPIKAMDLRDHFMDAAANGNKAYKKGTATPKATNGIKMLLSLKVLQSDGKGAYSINPESVLFDKASLVLAVEPKDTSPEA